MKNPDELFTTPSDTSARLPGRRPTCSMKRVKTLVAGLAASVSVGASAATTFGFEDVTVPFHTAVTVPDGYANASFDGFILRRVSEINGTGLNSNDVSQILAIAVQATSSINFATATNFDGAFLINPSGTMSFDLFLGTSLVASSAPIGVNASFVPSGYGYAIDRIVFHQAEGKNFSLDDLTVSPATFAAAVPEPQTYALMIAGMSLLSVAVRARKGR
jgi:hypothetical protein